MFAVVVFTEESDDTCKSVQGVPVSWLSEDKRFCRWPPRNSCIYTAKNAPPQVDWPWHPVEVERYCETLKEAKIKSTKEVSTDDEQLGKGFRAVKPKNYFSPDASVPRKRLPRDVQYELPPAPPDVQYHLPPALPDVQYEFSPAPPSAASVPPIKQVSTLEEGHTDYFDNEVYTLENPEQNSERTDSNSEHTITEIGTEYNHREAIRDNEEASAGFLTTINDKFDKIIEILSEHKLILDELLSNRKTESSSLPLVDFNLPLKTLEDINSLEEKLRDQNILGRFLLSTKNTKYPRETFKFM